MFNNIDIKVLLGKTLIKIEGLEKGSEEVVFHCKDGKKYKMYHDYCCCESVEIEEVIGDIENLLNTPLVMAEEVSNKGDTDYGTCTWTFYKLATNKGYVTIRWYGESNGWYSESVDFEEME